MKLSIVLPIHDGMKGGADFLWKNVLALSKQTFQDFEIVITNDGKIAENTNSGIKKAKGEIIKILYLDDTLSHDNVLKEIVDEFEGGADWLITGSDNNLDPYWTEDIATGNNKLGSPSALAFRNEDPLLFDENLSWLLDCDLYHRLYERYGEPMILPGNYITIGIGDHQLTRTLTEEDKLKEYNYMRNKYEKN
jgi:glycosyltransferase involved in cell wall biosynthesis